MPNDKQLRFADNDSIVANAAAAVDPVGDVLDLGTGRKTFWPDDQDAPNDVGDNELIWEASVSTALVGNGAVVTLALYNHTAATNLDSGNLIDSVVFTVGASGIPVGKFIIRAGVPAGRINERYLGIVASIATQNLTAGKIDSALTNVKERNAAHGQGVALA